MLRKNLFLTSCAFCMAVFFYTPSSYALVNQEIAQGDGDPTEVSAEEQLLAEQQLADEEKLNEDNVATVTASGDFLVPTYLLPVVSDEEAQAQAQAQAQANATDDTLKLKQTTTISNVNTKTERELPVVVIKQTELIPVSEQMEVERRLTGSTKQTQKIYNEAIARQKARLEKDAPAPVKDETKDEAKSSETTPASGTIVVEKKDDVKADKKAQTKQADLGRNLMQQNDDIDAILEASDESIQDNQTSGTKKPLLLPLRPLTVAKSDKSVFDSAPIAEPKTKTFPSEYADKVLSAAQANEKLPLIMPMDLKVSFYPNASAFSGQSVKWVKAFAYRAIQDPRYVVNVRVSKTNPLLQQKRLYLVISVLRSTGLSLHQLSIDYVDRDQDSMILRTIQKQDKKQIEKRGKGPNKTKETIKW